MESDVWFGWYSQWLARLADLSRQPFGLGIFITNIDLTFGLVFSVHSMQTSWGVLSEGRLELTVVFYESLPHSDIGPAT